MSKVIAILGMHRSGTSMLTGCLEEAGLVLGEVETKYNEHNEKGQKEEIFLMELHEAVLQSNGGSWQLPPYTSHWRYFHRACLKLYISKMSSHELWGFKDPRTILLLEEWKKQVTDLNLIGIFRHPWKVAHSLHKRNGFSYVQGLDLWLKYNRKLWEA